MSAASSTFEHRHSTTPPPPPPSILYYHSKRHENFPKITKTSCHGHGHGPWAWNATQQWQHTQSHILKSSTSLLLKSLNLIFKYTIISMSFLFHFRLDQWEKRRNIQTPHPGGPPKNTTHASVIMWRVTPSDPADLTARRACDLTQLITFRPHFHQNHTHNNAWQ